MTTSPIAPQADHKSRKSHFFSSRSTRPNLTTSFPMFRMLIGILSAIWVHLDFRAALKRSTGRYLMICPSQGTSADINSYKGNEFGVNDEQNASNQADFVSLQRY